MEVKTSSVFFFKEDLVMSDRSGSKVEVRRKSELFILWVELAVITLVTMITIIGGSFMLVSSSIGINVLF